MTDGVAFLDLRPGDCRYPLGEPDYPPSLFCGAPARAGSSYCACHHRLAYLAPAKRRAGQLLAVMEKPKGGGNGSNQFKATNATREAVAQKGTLKELGISPKQSSNWQRLAKVPDEQFEDRSRCAEFAHNRPPNFHENLGKN